MAPGALDYAIDQVRALMRARRHDAPGQEDSFTISTNDTFVDLWKRISETFATVIVGIASISLVVGGVVIMNIMLVSVTERTREIGIRKALGAKRKDVLLQFLLEAASMSLLGGFFGVIGGVSVAEIFTTLIGWPSSVALWSVLLGLFVATGVGIFFGVYPAHKAAMLDPIVALRSEL
jgi:putative ABC transport system permease protein